MKYLGILLFFTICNHYTFSQVVLSQTTVANYVAEICEPGITFSNPVLTGDSERFNEASKPIFTTSYDPYHYELLVFDRWGEKVVESYDTNIG